MRRPRWSLRARLLTITGVAVLITAVLGAQLIARYTQTRDALADVLVTLAPASHESALLDRSIDTMDRSLRSYTVSADPDQRASHLEARESVAGSLTRLADLLAGRDPLPAMVSDIATAQDAWLAGVGDPVLAAMAAQDQARAQTIMVAPESDSLLAALSAASLQLAETLAQQERDAAASAADHALVLARSQAVALVVLLVLPVIGLLVLRRGVLVPVRRLRAQLRTAADPAQRHRRITPGGPSELDDLAVDAEELRRALVEQIDREQAARAGLEQQVPVVAAIRAELAAPPVDQSAPVRVAGFVRPAHGVLAGDFWDHFPLPDGATAIVLCDVSGSGPRAGIVAMRLRTTIRQGLMAGGDAPRILAGACADLADDAAAFATLIILTVTADGSVTWVNAGHPAARVITDTRAPELLAPTGPIVSWLGGQWRVARRRITPGQIVLAFSDGLLDSRDPAGAELDEAGLDQLLQAGGLGRGSPAALVEALVASVRERAHGDRLDDLTLVAVGLPPPPAGAAGGRRRHPDPA